MRVLRDRLDQRPGPERLLGEAAPPLVDVPAEVDEPRRPARQPVDLLDLVLPDVADPEVARRAVEAVPPGVAQADRDELGRRLRLPDVEPEHLAEQRIGVLRVVLGIAARTAVAEPDPQLPVGAELEVAPVVVGIRLLDAEDLLRAARQGAAVRGAVAHDPRRAVALGGVVDVERPVARVARREREPEEPLLAAGDDERADVEERCRTHAPPLDDTNAPGLLDDVQAARLAGRLDDVDRPREPSDDDGELRRRAPCRERRRGRARRHERHQSQQDPTHRVPRVSVGVGSAAA